MRRVLAVLAWLVGVYFVVRGVVELFVVDFGDPASYRNDWGGPSLAGVLAVHCGPALIAGTIMAMVLVRRRRSRVGTR